MKHVLITQLYMTSNAKRNEELLHSLTRNIELAFDSVLLFSQGIILKFSDMRVQVHYVNESINFATMAYLANEPFHRDDIIILTNTDIVLDRHIIEKTRFIERGEFWSISRYDNNELTLQPSICQDTWCIRGQELAYSILSQTKFRLGAPGCELRVSEVFHSAGFKVSNPCLSIINHHIDSNPSIVKEELRLFGSYLITEPTTLESRIQTTAKVATFYRAHENTFFC